MRYYTYFRPNICVNIHKTSLALENGKTNNFVDFENLLKWYGVKRIKIVEKNKMD